MGSVKPLIDFSFSAAPDTPLDIAEGEEVEGDRKLSQAKARLRYTLYGSQRKL